MTNLSAKKTNCYCAFCKTPQRVYPKHKVGVMSLFGSLITSLLLMMVIWQEFNPRFLIFFLLFLTISEMFVQVRWRASVICKTCGFDPILYKKDPRIASQKVKEKLSERKERPENILAKPLNLPTISAEKSKAYERAGSLVSRQV